MVRQRRGGGVLAALATTLCAMACSSSGDITPGGGDGGGLGADGSNDSSSSADGAGGGSPDAGALADGTGADVDNGGGDAAPEAPTSCVTDSTVIAIVQTATGCAFSYTGPVPQQGGINLLLTPGWGTVCFAGSSGNCGTGSSADGWWFSGAQEIALCDATCTRFYNQTIAGKLTVQLGCPTEACMH